MSPAANTIAQRLRGTELGPYTLEDCHAAVALWLTHMDKADRRDIAEFAWLRCCRGTMTLAEALRAARR